MKACEAPVRLLALIPLVIRADPLLNVADQSATCLADGGYLTREQILECEDHFIRTRARGQRVARGEGENAR